MGVEKFVGNRVDDVKQSIKTMKNVPATSLPGQFVVEMLRLPMRGVFDIMKMFTTGSLKAAGTTARIAGKAVLSSIPVPMAGGDKATLLYWLNGMRLSNIERRMEEPGGLKAMLAARRERADEAAKDLNALPPSSQARSKVVGSQPDGPAV